MANSCLRRFLIITAALLTVSGSVSLLSEAEEPLAKLIAEVEDAEEDEREDTIAFVRVAATRTSLHFPNLQERPSVVVIPIVLGPHNQRGPPAV